MPPAEAWPVPPKSMLPSSPPANPPAKPCIKGLRLKKPPEGWPGVPRDGFLPGVLSPGEPMEGLDGVLGEEKLRLPRLPAELPPPALAQAVASTKVETTKNDRTKSAKPPISCFLISGVAPYRVKSCQPLVRPAVQSKSKISCRKDFRFCLRSRQKKTRPSRDRSRQKSR